MSQNQDPKLEIEPELVNLASDSEDEDEVEFLPMFGPFLAPYQGPSGNWIFPPGCPNIGWNLPQPASPPQLHVNNDWSDDDQVVDVSEDSAEESDCPSVLMTVHCAGPPQTLGVQRPGVQPQEPPGPVQGSRDIQD